MAKELGISYLKVVLPNSLATPWPMDESLCLCEIEVRTMWHIKRGQNCHTGNINFF